MSTEVHGDVAEGYGALAAEFRRNFTVRKESGAAIGVDEARQEYATYFPMVGDTPEKIQQKAEARRVVTLGMQKSAGKAYQPYVPPAPAPAPAAARPARLVYDPATRVYRYVQE